MALTQWVAADHLTDLQYDHRTASLRATYFDGLPFENEVVIVASEEDLAEFLRTEAEHHSWRDLNLEPLKSLGESLVMALEDITAAHSRPRRPIAYWRTTVPLGSMRRSQSRRYPSAVPQWVAM